MSRLNKSTYKFAKYCLNQLIKSSNKNLISKINRFLSKWCRNINKTRKINLMIICNKNYLPIQTNILSTIISRLHHQIMNHKIIKVSHQILLQEHRLNFIKKVKKASKREESYKSKMLNKSLKCKFLIVLFIQIFLSLKRKLNRKKVKMFSIDFILMLMNLRWRTISGESKSKINKKRLTHRLNLFHKSTRVANKLWNSSSNKTMTIRQRLKISTNLKSHSKQVKILLTSILKIKVQKRFSKNFMIQVFIKIDWTKQSKKLHKKNKINILSILNSLLEPKEWPKTYQIYKADWNSTL